MEHTANIHYPNTSPMWCNVNTVPMNTSINNYDGDYWYSWYPHHRNWIIWYDNPLAEEMLDGNLCYRVNGNIWICPVPPTEGNLTPEPTPMPVSSGNIKPSMTLTSVKMENHPEHIAVMFGQVLSSLK